MCDIHSLGSLLTQLGILHVSDTPQSNNNNNNNNNRSNAAKTIMTPNAEELEREMNFCDELWKNIKLSCGGHNQVNSDYLYDIFCVLYEFDLSDNIAGEKLTDLF
jgi:hypothetical protein